MGTRIKREISPYRRFTLILGSSFFLIGAALTLVTIVVIHDFVVKETVELTQQAVNKHFVKLPQLAGVFAGGKQQGGSENKEYGSANDSYDSSYKNNDSSYQSDPHSHGLPQDYEGLYGLVRMHFDLYWIESTRFYYPDGLVTFSYDRAELGSQVAADQRASFIQAAEGHILEERTGQHGLHIWVPVHDEAQKVIGIVELTRDIAIQDRASSRVITLLLVVILCCLIMLFFALRQVFTRSTRTIDLKNRELARMVNTIERTYDQSLQALSSALDLRDNETQGHSFRVTSYAIRLGRELRLSDDELGLLARGALLHDVGKIGVPDGILLKKGKLTNDEWVIMRKHVQIGYQMLCHIEFLQPSLDVVMCHHESWDGHGYPYGLKGEEIPLFARIFALCDTYDAITSDRPYRKRRDYMEARAEIVRCSGTQFSLELVEAFLRIPEEEWADTQQMSHLDSAKQRLDQMLHQAGA